MFEQFPQTPQVLPFGDLLSLNTRTLKKLGECQSSLMQSLMKEGLSFATALPQHREVTSLFAAQKQFAEKVQQHTLASMKAGYKALEEAREEGSKLLTSANIKADAKPSPRRTVVKKPAVNKPPAPKTASAAKPNAGSAKTVAKAPAAKPTPKTAAKVSTAKAKPKPTAAKTSKSAATTGDKGSTGSAKAD